MTTIGDLYFEYNLFRPGNDRSIYHILGLPDDLDQWMQPLTPSQEAKYRAILGPWQQLYETEHGPLPSADRGLDQEVLPL